MCRIGGVRVPRFDPWSAMVARLRAEPGGDGIAVAIGDFATTRVDGTFALVYLVRNTTTHLTAQDDQVRASAARPPILRPAAASSSRTGVLTAEGACADR